MAGTPEAPFFGTGNHGARQVRAFLSERDELAGREPHEQTRFVFVWIGESDGGADGNVIDRHDPLDGQLSAAPAVPVLEANPELPDSERRARQHHELHEVATLDIQVLRDRKSVV